MELRQLQYFVKVARKQHVTKASEELHVAQSAVSRQIHQLEQQLGAQLFIQKGRNLQLTSVGRLFLNRVETVLTDLERAVLEVHEFMNPDAGEVRIGFPHSLGVDLVPALIADFRKDHPNVTFRLKQGRYGGLIKELLEGHIDLAFISPFPDKHDQATGELLWTEDLLAILPPNHILADYQSIRLEQLKEEAFVLFSEGYSLRNIVMEACRKAAFDPKISFEGEETDTIKGLVAAGLGVSLLPEIALRDGRGKQPLKMRISDPKVTRTVGLMRRPNEKLPLVAEVFRRFVLEYFAV